MALRVNVRHGEGLAGSGHPEKDLLSPSLFNAPNQLFDRLRLISLGLKIGDQAKLSFSSWALLHQRKNNREAGMLQGKRRTARLSLQGSFYPFASVSLRREERIERFEPLKRFRRLNRLSLWHWLIGRNRKRAPRGD